MNSHSIHTAYKVALKIIFFLIVFFVFDHWARKSDLERCQKLIELEGHGLKTICHYEHYETTFQGNLKEWFVTNLGDTIIRTSKMSIDGYIRRYPEMEDTIIYSSINPQNFYSFKKYLIDINSLNDEISPFEECFNFVSKGLIAYLFYIFFYRLILLILSFIPDSLSRVFEKEKLV